MAEISKGIREYRLAEVALGGDTIELLPSAQSILARYHGLVCLYNLVLNFFVAEPNLMVDVRPSGVACFAAEKEEVVVLRERGLPHLKARRSAWRA